MIARIISQRESYFALGRAENGPAALPDNARNLRTTQDEHAYSRAVTGCPHCNCAEYTRVSAWLPPVVTMHAVAGEVCGDAVILAAIRVNLRWLERLRRWWVGSRWLRWQWWMSSHRKPRNLRCEHGIAENRTCLRCAEKRREKR